MHIPGHTPGIDVSSAIREDTEDLDLWLGRVRTEDKLPRLQYIVERLAAWVTCSKGDVALACRAIRIRTRTIWAMFARAQYSSYEAWLGEGENIVFAGTGPTGETHVQRWKDGVACAVLANDEYVLENMARVPMDVVRSSSTRFDEHAYTHMRALQAYLKADPRAPDLVMEAMEQTDPQQLKIAPAHCLATCVGEIELLGNLMFGKGGELDEALERALVTHREYWTSSPERVVASEGLLPVNLVALVRLAVQRGQRVTTTSDYIPADLIEGR